MIPDGRLMLGRAAARRVINYLLHYADDCDARRFRCCRYALPDGQAFSSRRYRYFGDADNRKHISGKILLAETMIYMQ